MLKSARSLLVLLCASSFLFPTQALASYTLAGNGTWASVGDFSSTTILADAQSGGDVALAGNTLTITNDGISNDGDGFDTFNIGNITDAGAGSVSIIGTQEDTNNLIVNLTSASVGSDFSVENTDGASGNGVTTTISGNLSTATLELTNRQATTTNTNTNLIVDGNLNTTGAVTVTGGSAGGSNAILSLEGSTISAGSFSLSATGPSFEGNGELIIGGSGPQSVTGTINSSAPTDYGYLILGEDSSGNQTSNNITMQSAIGNINQIGVTFVDGTGTTTFNGTVNTDILYINNGSNTVFNQNVNANELDFFTGGTMTLADGVNLSATNINNGADAALGTLIIQGTSTLTGNIGQVGIPLNQISLTGSAVTVTASGTVATTNMNLGNNTMNIAGSYTQAANGTLATTINSSTVYGRITATGNAAIPNSTAIDVTVSGSLPDVGTTFNLVDDNGSAGINVPGTVSVTGSSRVFRAMVSAGDLLLYLEPVGGLSPFITGTNALKAGAVLDSILGTATGDMGNVINELNNLTPSQVSKAVNTMLPVTGYNMEASTQMMDDFVSTQMTHLNTPTNTDMAAGDPTAVGMSSGSQPMSTMAWAQLMGGTAHQSARGSSGGYNLEDAGSVVGVEEALSDELRMGIAAGDSYSWVNLKDNNGRTNVNAIQASLYGRYKTLESPWYVNFAGMYNYNTYTGSRDVSVGPSDNRVAKSSYTGGLYGGSIETGYGLAITKAVITPDFEVSYDRLNVGKYHETNAGALDLNVKAQNYDRLELAPGIKIELPFEFTYGVWTPEVHAYYLEDVISSKEQIVAAFSGGGSAFVTNGFKPSTHGFDLGGALTLVTYDNITLSLRYDFEDRLDYFSNTGLLNVGYQF